MEPSGEQQPRVSEAFASVLRSGRAEFNHQFAEARRLYPGLDGAAFAEFLSGPVERLVRATEQRMPDRVTEVIMAAYEAGLELVGQKLVGRGTRHHWIEEGWQRILPLVPARVATAPARVMGAVSNALHHLADSPGARPDQWLSELERLGPQCPDAEELLRVGQVAAWRAGLAHFRQGALAAADALPPALALAAVGALVSNSWPELRERLQADPWFDPAAPKVAGNGQTSRVRVMTQAGAFRGFGGLFVEPPLVAATGEHFVARSGEECWLLMADVFGATFHRTSPADFNSAQAHTNLPAGLRVGGSKVVWGQERFEIPSLGKFTSAAANANTLALTSELTHSIILVALG